MGVNVLSRTETLFVPAFTGAVCEERDFVEGDEAGILPRPRLVPGLRQVRSCPRGARGSGHAARALPRPQPATAARARPAPWPSRDRSRGWSSPFLLFPCMINGSRVSFKKETVYILGLVFFV